MEIEIGIAITSRTTPIYGLAKPRGHRPELRYRSTTLCPLKISPS